MVVEAIQRLDPVAVDQGEGVERTVGEHSPHQGFHRIGERLHQSFAEAGLVVFQGDILFPFLSVDEDAQGKFRCADLEVLTFDRPAVHFIAGQDTDLIGEHDLRLETVVRRNLRERIGFVLQRRGE